jgi:hypothetical protein
MRTPLLQRLHRKVDLDKQKLPYMQVELRRINQAFQIPPQRSGRVGVQVRKLPGIVHIRELREALERLH